MSFTVLLGIAMTITSLGFIALSVFDIIFGYWVESDPLILVVAGVMLLPLGLVLVMMELVFSSNSKV